MISGFSGMLQSVVIDYNKADDYKDPRGRPMLLGDKLNFERSTSCGARKIDPI